MSIPDNAIFYRPKGIPTLKKSNFWATTSKTYYKEIQEKLKDLPQKTHAACLGPNEDEKIEYNDSLFYVFVNLNIKENKGQIEYGSVDYYVVPMKKVKDFIYKKHRDWLNAPGKHGQAHNDSTMRKYCIQPDDELNNFDILGLKSNTVDDGLSV